MSFYGYTIGNVIGKGAYGIVRLATKDGHKYAIKQIKLEEDKTKQFPELNQLKVLSHDNILRLHDYIEEKSDHKLYLYLVNDYCNNGDICALMSKTLPHNVLPEEMAQKLLRGIARGIEFLCLHSILHRDIKPQNIFLFEEQVNGQSFITPKIGDFGFSKELVKQYQDQSLSEMTTHSELGTPCFYCPEMLEKGTYNYKCDIFALGVTYYYMLFKQAPFRYDNDAGYLARLRKGDVEFNLAYESISKVSIDFIMRCLLYNPEERMSLAQLMSHGLVTKYYSVISKPENLIPKGTSMVCNIRSYEPIANYFS